MLLDDDTCYRAARSRDARFDGRFFIAVTSTGIYCRPICPARTPLRKNVRFYACAAAAEQAGFRPCRRCRPETAPGTPPWLGPSATVSRALALIERGALDEAGIDALAERLGVGDRHLRRLFQRHLGTSPQAVASSRRAHFARLLLDAPELSITEVAFASGFGSVRQFNDTMRGVFRRTPTELRRGGRALSASGAITLRLGYRPPLDYAALLGFLAARAAPGVESVCGDTYRRTFSIGGESGELAVRPEREGVLSLVVSGGRAHLLELQRRVRRLFDLDADPLAIAAGLAGQPLLAPSLAARPGLRVPGAWDPFETLARAILGQQVSVRAATTLAGRLVARFGAPYAGEGGLDRLFPAPEALAEADLAAIGLPRARAESLRGAAARVARDPALLEPGASLEETVARLADLPGVGPWTASYVALRALGEPDAFPAGDLVLRRVARVDSPAALERLADPWRPWRGYATLHLWASASEAPGKQAAAADLESAR